MLLKDSGDWHGGSRVALTFDSQELETASFFPSHLETSLYEARFFLPKEDAQIANKHMEASSVSWGN